MSYAGTLVGTENPEPANYTITIKGSSQLRHVVARTNPIELENVPAPPAPTGTRDEAQIDHIIPKKPADPNIPPGTNSYKNAKVISRQRNRQKSNKCIL